MTTPLTTDLLASVSRSFYLSMRFLPSDFRQGMSTAYLLARATDTIADTAQSSGEERLSCLTLMGDAIQNTSTGSTAPEELILLLRSKFAPTQEHSGEAELLNRFDEVLGLLAALSLEEQQAVKKMLFTIVEGQSLDLRRFDCQEPFDTHILYEQGKEIRRLQSKDALYQYTYYVAGCVGEFWTELGFIHQGNHFAKKSKETMMELGKEFGQGLQLVNILRDLYEDKERGRIYLPDDSIYEYIQQAQKFLKSGFKYARYVHGVRMKFAVKLPADLGFKTLKLLPQLDSSLPKPKISRSQVYQSAIFSLISALSPL